MPTEFYELVIKEQLDLNAKLNSELCAMREQIQMLQSSLQEMSQKYEDALNQIAHLQSILNNNSNNSSLPPSSDPPGKSANRYNGRKNTDKKPGGQKGHKGKTLTKEEIEEKIKSGEMKVIDKTIGKPSKNYITRYRVDLTIETVVTRVKIYANEDGKYDLPKEYAKEVSYGDTVKSLAAYLYSEGIVANERIRDFLNSISNHVLNISSGAVYGFCKQFAKKCSSAISKIKDTLLKGTVVCTDATCMSVNGKQIKIRNFSNKDCVLFIPRKSNNIETLLEMPVLSGYDGILVHDHETALYHIQATHAECNAHILRYLQKNTEECKHSWSTKMQEFLCEVNNERQKLIASNDNQFSDVKIQEYENRYDEIIALGWSENDPKSRCSAKEERALLRRMTKFKGNHLLFIHDFRVPFTNNMSEQDLRQCKGRQKIAGGFRKDDGSQMFCDILSVVETIKRHHECLFQEIHNIFAGESVYL